MVAPVHTVVLLQPCITAILSNLAVAKLYSISPKMVLDQDLVKLL